MYWNQVHCLVATLAQLSSIANCPVRTFPDADCQYSSFVSVKQNTGYFSTDPWRPLYGLALYVDNAFEHGACVHESVSEYRGAAEVPQLQQAVVDGLARRVDEGHQVVLRVRRDDHLRVVLEKVHLFEAEKAESNVERQTSRKT